MDWRKVGTGYYTSLPGREGVQALARLALCCETGQSWERSVAAVRFCFTKPLLGQVRERLLPSLPYCFRDPGYLEMNHGSMVTWLLARLEIRMENDVQTQLPIPSEFDLHGQLTRYLQTRWKKEYLGISNIMSFGYSSQTLLGRLLSQVASP